MAKRKADPEVTKPTKKPSKAMGEVKYSLCIPSSIISSANAKNLEQITYVAYQIAKAATIYNVVEIVILDIPTVEMRQEKIENQASKVSNAGLNRESKKIVFGEADTSTDKKNAGTESEKEEAHTAYSTNNENNHLLLATLLQYFVTPPYLVKSVFANSEYAKKFKYAQQLPKLSTLPFMSNNEVYKSYKEGITVPKHTPKVKKKSKKVAAAKKLSVTKYVNVGKSELLELAGAEVPVNMRVTVDVKNKKIVSPADAYGVVGAKSSFGYYVRPCKNFSSIFTEASAKDGYSYTIYIGCDDFFNSTKKVDQRKSLVQVAPSSSTAPSSSAAHSSSAAPSSGNVLLVLGHWKDLDYTFQQDKESLGGVESMAQMFDGELSVPDGVRTEDAALIALSKLAQ